MSNRRTYSLDAENFKKIVDFVLYFQQGYFVADEDEERPASQHTATNIISRRSRGKRRVETYLENKDRSSVLIA